MLQVRIQSKFLGLILGSLAVLLGAFSYIVVERESHLLAKKGMEKQRLLADTVLADLKQSMLTGKPRNTLDLMRRLQGSSGLIQLKALRRDGTPAFGVAGNRIEIPRLDRLFLTGVEMDYLEQGDLPIHTILLPLKNEGECRGCHKKGAPVLGAIMVSLSMKDTEEELFRSKQDFTILLSLLVMVIGGVLYLLIKKIILSPLITLHQGAEAIGDGNLSYRIDLTTNDEFQDLATAFNNMTAQIKESHADLENRIIARTGQLEHAMEEVQDKAEKLYAYGRDMATISGLSTEVFNAELSQDDLLDRFMGGVTNGLGYTHAMLCLVNKKRAWLDIKRDTGIGDRLRFNNQSLLSDDPLVRLIRCGEVTAIEDGDDAFSFPGIPGAESTTFFIIPLLNHRHARRCWQITSCIKTDCPAHHERSAACWLTENTLCGNPLIASYGNKLAYCMTCQVFPVQGVLIVAADRQRKLSRNKSISVLRILAAEMAAALENHRLHEDNQQMVRELLELHRVTAIALSELSLTKALEVFTDSALKFSGMDTCTFWLVSPDGGELVRKAGGCIDEGELPDLCPDRLPLDQGLIGQAFHQNSFVIDYNVAGHDRTILSRAAATHGLNSLLAVSLKSESGPIGVFAVHKRDTSPFLETEIAAFMLLANQAAMAISVCLLNDELKSQNRALTRHMNLLSGILSSMSSGVMLLDTGGRVMLVNQAGASLLRTRREDLVNQRLTELFPDAAAFIRSPIGPYQDIEIRLPDGAGIPIGFSSTDYHGAAGEHEGVIVVYQDLSEIKTLQAELLNKERFAAMGRVVSGVAHEIRNPLFGISSVGQILERELVNPAHVGLVQALLSETRRMNQLVEDLLLYSKPIKLNLAWCDLAGLWKEVFIMHQDELDQKGIRRSNDLDNGLMPSYLDAHQIRQMFLNLFRNAIDATPPGGEIRIRLLLEDRFIVFMVSDDGIGIPAKNKDKIFDLFFTTKPKGTGLGLGICKKIVQDHGGSIDVKSDEGKGTAVIVKLPYRGTAAEEPDQR